MAPSEMVAWECGACTFTNEDVQRRDCLMCMTERPLRYAIVPGATGAASARTTTVNRREQARLAVELPVVAARDATDEPPPQQRRKSLLLRGFPWRPLNGRSSPNLVALSSSAWLGRSLMLLGRRRRTGAALFSVTPAADRR